MSEITYIQMSLEPSIFVVESRGLAQNVRIDIFFFMQMMASGLGC